MRRALVLLLVSQLAFGPTLIQAADSAASEASASASATAAAETAVEELVEALTEGDEAASATEEADGADDSADASSSTSDIDDSVDSTESNRAEQPAEAAPSRPAEPDYDVKWQAAAGAQDFGQVWQATNAVHGFRSEFTEDGVKISPQGEPEPSWTLSLLPRGYGRGLDVRPLPPATLTPQGKRIDSHRGGLTGWYVNDERGLKQGFVLSTPPEEARSFAPARRTRGGRGSDLAQDRADAAPAFLLLELEGNLLPIVRPDGQTVDFAQVTGGFTVVSYSELKVTDAAGRELAAWMEAFNDGPLRGIRIVFDDAGAVYPVTVDPLASSASWIAEGDKTGAHLGWSVAAAGDVNGDGFDDVIVGAPGHEPGGGRVYVYHGSLSGLSTTPSWTAEAGPGQDGAQLGYSVAGAGDVNNDGFDDVIFGAPLYDDPAQAGIEEGAAFLFLGSATGLKNTCGGPCTAAVDADWSGFGEDAGDHYGWSVDGAGDVCFDNNDDWIVGAPDHDGPLGADQGRAYAYHGSAPVLAARAADWFADGEAAGDRFGFAVSAAGNVDADTDDDVIVGAPEHDGGRGQARVFTGDSVGMNCAPGEAGGLTNPHEWTADGEAVGDHFGSSVDSAGNVDGYTNADCLKEPPDNLPNNVFDDWIVGAPDHGNQGRAYVYLGATPVTAAWDAGGAVQANNDFGRSVAGVGDTDNDCNDDVLIGATGWQNPAEREGRAYLYLAPSTSTRPRAWDTEGNQFRAELGHAVAPAGDVNGDGIPDVLLGAPLSHRGQVEEGRAFVFHGAPSLVTPGALADQLGIGASSPNWDVFSGVTLDRLDTPDAVWFGALPRSVLLTTGRGSDGGFGSTDWGGDGLEDEAYFFFTADVPVAKKTLCFTTQFLTSEDPPDTDLARFCFNRDGGGCSNYFELSSLAYRDKNPPVSHCIDVDGKSDVFLRFEVLDVGNGDNDSGLLLSRFYFSGLAMPDDVLPDTVDGYFQNPSPQDVSRTAGTFSHNLPLFNVPGMSMPFEFTLSYNSESTEEGSLGPKWTHNLNAFAVKYSDADDDTGTAPDDILVKPGGGAAYFLESDACSGSGAPCIVATEDCLPSETCDPAEGVYRSRFGGTYGSITLNGDGTVTHVSKDRRTLEFTRVVAGTMPVALQLTSITDVNGHAMQYAYDASDLLDKVADTRGREFCFEYAGTRLERVAMSAGTCPATATDPSVGFGYDSSTGLLRTVTDLGGRATTFEYSREGRMLTATDADGTVFVANTYETFTGLGLDQDGDRVASRRDGRDDPLDPTQGQSFTYDNNSMTFTDRLDVPRSMTNAFDVKGRQAVNIDRTGVREESVYDRNNNKIAVRRQLPSEASPRVTSTARYDERGNLLEQVAFPDTCVGGPAEGNGCNDDTDCPQSACGFRNQRSYDLRDNVRSATDHAGNAQTYDYDANDNLIRERDALENEVVHTYGVTTAGTVFPSPVSTTDARGETSICGYANGTGYLIAATGPMGNEVTHTYDSLGYRTSTTDPRGGTTCRQYDAAGRVLARGQGCDADCIDLANCVLLDTMDYDAQGREAKRVENVGTAVEAVYETTYSPTGKIAEESDPLNHSTRFAYDAEDRLVSHTDRAVVAGVEQDRRTTYTYDDADRVSAVCDAASTCDLEIDPSAPDPSATAAYSESGYLLCIQGPTGGPPDFAPSVTRFGYDLLGQVVCEADGSAMPCDQHAACDQEPTAVLSTYDGRQLLTSLTNARGSTITYEYDAAGRATRTRFGATTIEHILDGNGNRVWSARDGGSVSRTFDGLDRLTSRTDEFGYTVGYAYDEAGNLSTLTYPSGVAVDYEYDALNRLILVKDWMLNETSYTYDEAGNLETVTRPDLSVTTLTYDRARRLTGMLDLTGGFSSSYVLDPAGQITSATLTLPLEPDPATGPREDFSYGMRNELESRGAIHDADGNMTNVAIDGGSVNLDYNALNQLAQLARGSSIETYRYDADGLRVEAHRDTGTPGEESTSRYAYDITAEYSRLLEERDDSGVVVARYVYGLGLISRDDDDGGDPDFRVYHYDSRGSTVSLTDSGGTITDCYAYDPFGELITTTGVNLDGDCDESVPSPTSNPFRYNARDGVQDDDTGLYYMRSRYYAPELMRFVQRDLVFEGALADPQSLNRYAFVRNDPIRGTDPNGDFFLATLLTYAVIAAIGGAIGSAIAVAGECHREGLLGSGECLDGSGKRTGTFVSGFVAGASFTTALAIGIGGAVAAPFTGGASLGVASLIAGTIVSGVGAFSGAWGRLAQHVVDKNKDPACEPGEPGCCDPSDPNDPDCGDGTEGGTETDRLNPRAAPLPGPQETTGCGCACEVWR